MKKDILMNRIRVGETLPVMCLVAGFIVSRIIFYYSGIRFFSLTLDFYYQHIDIALLKNDLLRSVYYLHYQPPLFNIFLGIIVKMFPAAYAGVLQGIYIVTGIGIAVSLYFLMRRLEVSKYIGTALVMIFICSPSCAAYENFLLYMYPLALLLCLSAVFLHRFASRGRMSDAGVFFALLAAVVLIRGLYHIGWLIAAVMLVLLLVPKYRKRTLLACAVPLLLVAAVYVKNFVVFDMVTTSSGIGKEVAKMTTFQVPVNERVKLVKEGKISILSLIECFRSPDEYEVFFPAGGTGIPVLDNNTKTTGYYDRDTGRMVPAVNYNNIVYVPVTRAYLKDAFYMLAHYPQGFLRAARRALFVYLLSGPSKDLGEGVNDLLMRKISGFERFYNTVFMGEVLPRTGRWTFSLGDPNFEARIGIFWLIGLPFLCAYAFFRIIAALRRTGDRAFPVTMAFMLMTVVYITLAAMVLTVRTNNRYRFAIEPYVFVFAGLFIARLIYSIREAMEDRPFFGGSMTPARAAKYGVMLIASVSLAAVYGLSGSVGYTWAERRDVLKVTEDEPPDAGAFFTCIGQFFREKGDEAKAREYFRMAGQEPPGETDMPRGDEEEGISAEKENKLLKMLAKHQGNMGNFDMTALLLEAALKVTPDDIETYDLLGSVYYRRGEYERSEECFRHILGIDPGNRNALDSLAVVTDKLDPVSGMKSALAGVELREKVLRLNERGMSEGSSGNLDGAIALFNEALALAPDDAETLNNLGYAYFLKGEIKRSEEYFRRTLEVYPGHEKARHNLEAVRAPGSGEGDPESAEIP